MKGSWKLIFHVLIGLLVARSAYAERVAIAVRGPHASETQAALQRILDSLDVHPASGTVDVELQDLTPVIVHWAISVSRGKDVVRRAGISRVDALGARIGAAMLFGVLAREPEKRQHLALVVGGDRSVAPAVVSGWRTALQARGFLLVPDEDVQLARSTLKSTEEPNTVLSKLLSVPVIGVELRGLGSEIALQATVYDEHPRRGTLARVPADGVEPQVTTMLDFLPIEWRSFK